jgi:hypothetical protein
MPDGLLGVLRNEVLELAFCSLVVEEGDARIAKQRCELRPGIGRTHVDNTDCLDARAWRLGIDQVNRPTCEITVPMDPLYLSVLVSAEKKFWRCVQRRCRGATPIFGSRIPSSDMTILGFQPSTMAGVAQVTSFLELFR